MEKATVGDVAPSVNSPLRGIPRGMICRVVDLREHLHLGYQTWQLWREAGLRTIASSGSAEMVYTDDLIEFLLSGPKIEAAKANQTKKREAKKSTPKKRSS